MTNINLQGEYTGRFLLTGTPGNAKETIASIKKSSGLSVANSRDFKDQAIGADDLDSGDGVYFDEIGVALISPTEAGQLNSLAADNTISAMEGDGPVIEPERVVHALDEKFGDYLRGMRDAVNLVADRYEPDSPEQADMVQELDVLANGSTWGLQKTRVVPSFPYHQPYNGNGIKVAVLDTGMDLNHPDFAGRAIISQSFVPNEAVQDGHSHGTHCIGTSCGPANPSDAGKPRYGVAFGASIYAGKVLNNGGSGADAWILAGINWAIGQGCHVISMSLGAAVNQPGYSAAYEAAGQAAFNAGCLIVAAAGNSYGQPVGHPANCPSIMAVGSVDENLMKSDFSNITFYPPHGKVDIVGPGRNVFSSVPVNKGTWGTMSGTSMATPHVAGIAALYAQQNASYRGAALWQRLVSTALALPNQPGTHVGAGLVQAPVRRFHFEPFPIPFPFPRFPIDPRLPIPRPVLPVPPRPVPPVPPLGTRSKKGR